MGKTGKCLPSKQILPRLSFLAGHCALKIYVAFSQRENAGRYSLVKAQEMGPRWIRQTRAQ